MSRNWLCPSIYIPEELIFEILKRLPAKSLLRFMSVCKSWYSLIRSPNFISSHYNHQINGPRYLLYSMLDDFYVHADTGCFDRHLEFTYPRMFSSVGCSNGIVCFSFYRDDKSFVVWNSSLGKSLDIKVPHCTVSVDEKSTSWFGFDVASNDYKVVWVAYSTSRSWETRPLGVYIYSLNERSWRCVNSSFVLDDVYLIQCKGVYLNGVIHWVAESYYDERDMPVSILTFNLAGETFGEFHLPSEIVYVEPDYRYFWDDDYLWPEDRVDLMIVKRGNKNCLAIVHEDLTNLNLWVMEEEGILACWRKDLFVSRNGIKKVLNVRMNGEIVMQLESGGVVSWDYRLYKMKLVSGEKMFYEGTYVESLVLL